MNKLNKPTAAINKASRISRIVAAMGLMITVCVMTKVIPVFVSSLVGHPVFGLGLFSLGVASFYLAMTAITGLDPLHALVRAATNHEEIPKGVAHQS